MTPTTDMNHRDPDSRVQSPRPGTPEPSSRQGRRNTQTDTQLLDDDGAISQKVAPYLLCRLGCLSLTSSVQLEACLKHIFTKYCRPPPPAMSRKSLGLSLLSPPEGAYLTPEGLDEWARDTNGAPFTQETKDELIEFLDVTDDGGLTWVFPFRTSTK
jgi:hypothetical protein